jgi:hypothetical protein
VKKTVKEYGASTSSTPPRACCCNTPPVYYYTGQFLLTAVMDIVDLIKAYEPENDPQLADFSKRLVAKLDNKTKLNLETVIPDVSLGTEPLSPRNYLNSNLTGL